MPATSKCVSSTCALALNASHVSQRLLSMSPFVSKSHLKFNLPKTELLMFLPKSTPPIVLPIIVSNNSIFLTASLNNLRFSSHITIGNPVLQNIPGTQSILTTSPTTTLVQAITSCLDAAVVSFLLFPPHPHSPSLAWQAD